MAAATALRPIVEIAPPSIPTTFKAKWTPENQHLKIIEPSWKDKICRFVWDLISFIFFPIGIARMIGWAVGFIAKNVTILPASWFYPLRIENDICKDFERFCFGPINKSNQSIRKHFDISCHSIETPDKVKIKEKTPSGEEVEKEVPAAELNAYYFKHKELQPNDETIIFFQSNASFTEQEIYFWLLEESIKRDSPCNFVVFDYRGVSASTGTAKDIFDYVIDGDSAYQFVEKGLGVPPHKIRTYGWSLGGIIGGTIKSMHPECTARFSNERSLYSVRDVAKYTIPQSLRPFFFWVPYSIENQRWNLSLAFEKIKGDKQFIVHKKDPIIPYEPSAHNAARKAGIVFNSVELYQTPEQIAEVQNRKKKRKIDHHSEPLGNYMVAPGVLATDRIAEFILPPQRAAAIQEQIA